MTGSTIDIEKYTGLSVQQLASVGFCALVWNGLETGLQRLIFQLGFWPHEIGLLVTADMGNVSRVTLFSNLVNMLVDDDLLKQHCEDFAFFFDGLRVRRNNVIHSDIDGSIWRSPSTILVKRSAKAGSGKVTEFEVKVDQESLEELIADLDLCERALRSVSAKVDSFVSYRMKYGVGDRQECHNLVYSSFGPSDGIAQLQTRLKALHPQRQLKRSKRLPPQSSGG